MPPRGYHNMCVLLYLHELHLGKLELVTQSCSNHNASSNLQIAGQARRQKSVRDLPSQLNIHAPVHCLCQQFGNEFNTLELNWTVAAKASDAYSFVNSTSADHIGA
jgi:hypothetical protein